MDSVIAEFSAEFQPERSSTEFADLAQKITEMLTFRDMGRISIILNAVCSFLRT